MLSNRINTALETLNITITDVARAGGCSPSNLNRLKNGVRTPAPSSPTIEKLARGLVEAAYERQLTDELCRLTGVPADIRGQQLKSAVIDWLFIDESPYERTYRKSVKAGPPEKTLFSSRLDLLMKKAGLSNKRLGQASGLDPSYISRLRRGERLPRFNAPYLTGICTAIWEAFRLNNDFSGLAALISRGKDELMEDNAPDMIFEWLFGYDSLIHHMTVDQLVAAVSSISDSGITAAEERISSRQIDLLVENCLAGSASLENRADELQGTGTDGLRSMVGLFLAEALTNYEEELLLYSDQSMDWMGGEYNHVLTALMAECISRNMRIRIIHTVDRSIAELAAAITWWAPLYLSGNIESYYCKRTAGGRFSHTLFIRPSSACIAGTGVKGMEEKTVYRYSTDPETAKLSEESFRNLLDDSEPLVRISAPHEETSKAVAVENVRIKASLSQVSITRIEEPKLSFTFTHPMICRAFAACVRSR